MAASRWILSVSRDAQMLDVSKREMNIQILKDYMSYDGYVSLEDVCNTWIITLLALGKA